MIFAEVAVGAAGGHRHTFSYSVPHSLEVEPGCAVYVPFGPRVVRGIVTGLSDSATVAETRDIISIISPRPLVTPGRIRLAFWIAEYYIAPIFSTLALMLPPGFAGKRQVKPKYRKYLVLNFDGEQLPAVLDQLGKSRAPRQAGVLEALQAAGGRSESTQVLKKVGCGRPVITALISRGLVREVSEDVVRDPIARTDHPLEFPLQFTDGQQAAWMPIREAIHEAGGANMPGMFLLHGVTGSGKTEIYLQALAETVKKGRKGICLVPEISLTPQVIDRFFARFPGRVAVLHSGLSAGELYDEWRRIARGDFDIVVGPRSAVFAPQPDLGLIIVDEEHEWAYKQSEKTPRYHAREVAIELARLTNSVLIMGSATPDVETYYRATRSEFQLVELSERVTPLGLSPLPEVDVVDMRQELKSGNRGIFSRLLRSSIAESLDRREQVILFINRRGRSTFVECRDCGYVLNCRRCSGALTYHAAEKRLVCHHCRRSYTVPRKCPQCSGSDIKFFGIGTESVEAECRKLFPSAGVIRFDSDAVAGARAFEKVVDSFRRRRADILVGTQMLAKGLDFPGVSLVGIVSADTSLNLPDFRSGERTFQLLCQVEGRAGRGICSGRAVVQTYNPGYYAIKFAAQHDYGGFYSSEIRYRREFGYPPFNRMARLVYSHSNEGKCLAEAERRAGAIRQKIAAKGYAGIKIIGPAPAYVAKLRGRYQAQVILLGPELHKLLQDINLPAGWVLDVDPVGMI
jgi:primosomal protein N' (replication factor Y) (superfamily II helicase)